MGRETRNFRQTAKSRSGSEGNRNYSGQNSGRWHTKIIEYFKMKKGVYGKS